MEDKSSPSAPFDEHIQFEEFSLDEKGSPTTGHISPQQEPLIGSQRGSVNDVNPAFWSLEYYTFAFNVDTKQVLYRLLRSLIPFPPTFLDLVKNNPDLYGPFWIASTLIFCLTFSSHIADYIKDNKLFSYDVGRLSIAAAAIYGYLALVPILLAIVFHYYKIDVKVMQIFCIYGYSFFIYIPVSILCAIPAQAIQWAFIGAACLISTSFILCNFFRYLKEINSTGEESAGKKWTKSLTILALMGLFHIGFAIISKIFFF